MPARDLPASGHTIAQRFLPVVSPAFTPQQSRLLLPLKTRRRTLTPRARCRLVAESAGNPAGGVAGDQAMMTPQRVALDKSETALSFVYHNEVIKPALVGLQKPIPPRLTASPDHLKSVDTLSEGRAQTVCERNLKSTQSLQADDRFQSRVLTGRLGQSAPITATATPRHFCRWANPV